MLSKKKFVFEKGCDPKNPLLAEYGDGWGLFKILCLLSSINKIFSCAFLPHKINTKFSFKELSDWSILSVNISQPLLECEEGLEDSTVKIVLSNKTPCFAQFERSPCWDGDKSYSNIENKLSLTPKIKVPTITIDGLINGVREPKREKNLKKFTNLIKHK